MIMMGVCRTQGGMRSYRCVVGTIGQGYLFVCFWVGRQYLMHPRLSWTFVGLRITLNTYSSFHVHTQMVGLQAQCNFTHFFQS